MIIRFDENIVTDFHRECPTCKKRINYRNAQMLRNATKRGSRCKKCGAKARSNKILGKHWKWKSDESRKRTAEAHKNSAAWIASMNTTEYKQRQRETKSGSRNARWGISHTMDVKNRISELMKLRMNDPRIVEKYKKQKLTSEQRTKFLAAVNNPSHRKKMRENRIRQIKESGAFPSFNRNACKFFDRLNERLGWNGQHALNGGEREISGYSVDYFVPDLNLVIEWDEESHFRDQPTIQHDLARQRNILDTGVKMYRIREKYGKLTRADMLSEDYLHQIENVINENCTTTI